MRFFTTGLLYKLEHFSNCVYKIGRQYLWPRRPLSFHKIDSESKLVIFNCSKNTFLSEINFIFVLFGKWNGNICNEEKKLGSNSNNHRQLSFITRLATKNDSSQANCLQWDKIDYCVTWARLFHFLEWKKIITNEILSNFSREKVTTLLWV